ncbi:MAG: YiiX/YebB-like N1pC/P60 family cysteine hydrolase [Caldimonas sp.]
MERLSRGPSPAPLIAAALMAALTVSACATRFEPGTAQTPARLRLQDSALAPGQGGELVDAASLEPGDILLSAVATLQSVGIQLATFAPVSHALVYIGDGVVAEAVGEGVRTRPVEALLASESMVVAFRDPQLTAAQAARVRDWSLAQVGTRYNTFGVVLSAPFVINRRVCELPLVPGPVRDACVRGFATVQLGASRNDRFFCSQFVLEAYAKAGAPLSDADPRWVSPADLLHMREGDVATLAAARPLRYVGHLKYTAAAAAAAEAP